MLDLKIVSKNEKSVTYDYYPEGREKPGRITIDNNTQEVIYVKKSEYEEGNFDTYLGHAIIRVKRNIENNEFPETELVAWG